MPWGPEGYVCNFKWSKRVIFMVYRRKIIIALLFILFVVWPLDPIEIGRISAAIDVSDGTLLDWVDAPVQLSDSPEKKPVAQTDLAFVSFDYDDTWLYVRWDVYDNLSYSPQVLYDMGINLTGNLMGNDDDWDIYVSAETERVGGIPVLVNISIRDREDNHIWNASDDGNMTEDGTLYFDPTPGLPADNLSVEARFPLAFLGITSNIVFGQFRSHPSTSVESTVKDRVPDTGYIILFVDNIPPELSNLSDTPDPQENGGYVNITVDVKDDIGVENVQVNITYPNGNWVNVSMTQGTGDKWYYNTTYDDLGTYFYTVWANDTNNWNSTGPGDFTIQDTDGPIFDNLNDAPDPQENGGFVNITVDVTDDVNVDTVWINITYPDGSCANTSMDIGIGDEWYYNTAYDDLGIHSYTIWANDTSNNWNSIGPETFTIQDTDVPELSNVDDTPDPQENGGFVNITVDIIDDVGVNEVWVNITYPNGSQRNVSMNRGEGDEWYLNITYDDLGIYSYTAWANDTSGNRNYIGPGNFTIQDTDAPELTDLDDSPDPQENDGFVNITVDVVDDVGVNEVWIEIGYPNGTWINVSMNRGIGDEWYLNAPYTDLGDYAYTVWASDTSNNLNHTGLGSFIIQDTDGPELGDPDATPDPQDEGGPVNITVEVTDDVGTDEVWINITFPDGTWINVSMSQGTDGQWYYNDTFDDIGNYTYTIWAVDTSGNGNGTEPETFSIEPSEPPEKPPKLLYMTLLLVYWPLLLILFAIALVRRYEAGNRFKRDIDSIAPALPHNYAMHPDNLANNITAIQDIITFSLKTGIPVEEYILATLDAGSVPQLEGVLPNPVNEDLRVIKRIISR